MMMIFILIIFVFLYYIKGIVIIDKDYVSSQSFLYATNSIKKFIETFDLEEKKETN